MSSMLGRRIRQAKFPRMKNRKFPKEWKKQSVKKDGNYQKQGKTSNFQGRKVQENMPDIKQEKFSQRGNSFYFGLKDTNMETFNKINTFYFFQ